MLLESLSLRKKLIGSLAAFFLTLGGLFWMQGTGEESLPTLSQMEAATEKKQIALTFDDGPNPEYTRQILQVLEAEGVKGTFFLMGKEIQQYPEIVSEIHAGGHLIGNHTFSHCNVCQVSEQEALEEVAATNRLLSEITGEATSYFRPPFGCKNEMLEQSMGMIWVGWDIDTLDWSCQNAQQIYEEVVKNVSENDIILMHDAYGATVEAVKRLIPELKARGYTFVTVDALEEP